jgi:hypothetical protein
MNKAQLKKLEELENKYLKKYSYFLKFAEHEVLKGLDTGRKNLSYWQDLYGSAIKSGAKSQKTGISVYSRGAERVIYALLNGKGIGDPNSAPVGSDLFFEVEDAYIHIDLKTVGASLSGSSNIGDFSNDQFVGENQNSYEGIIKLQNGIQRKYKPNLPTKYTINKKTKPCLTYFICILYDSDTLKTLMINVMCMPNGELERIYKHKPLKAGKNPGKARFNFSQTPDFELLTNEKRIQVPYVNEKMDVKYKKQLSFLLAIQKHSIQ